MTDDDFLTVSHTVRGVPAEHLDSTLKNYNWNLQPGSKQDEIHTYLENMHDFIHDDSEDMAPNLYLFGPNGAGKTHLLIALWRWCVYRTDAGASTWIHVPTFVEEEIKSYDEEGPGPLDRIRDADVFLGLDDLFGTSLGEHEHKIVSKAISAAHQNGASIVTTANPRPREARAYSLRDHEISRLLANGTMLKFKEGDQRL